MNYNSPLVPQRADPYIYRHTDGYYYFTGSVPAYDGIELRRSRTVNGLTDTEEIKTVWKKHDSGIMSKHIWAPELHFLDGKFYIYFAAGEAEDIWKIRPYVLECSGDPMTGEWRELGMIQRADNDIVSFTGFSLDATIFEHGGERYYIWAEKTSFGNGHLASNLYIAKMETPWKLSTPGMLLTTPDYDWERIGHWVDEGPAVLIKNGKIFVTFSSSATGACYCMGMMEADCTSDLMDRNSWRKSRYPVLKTDAELGIYGSGHNSFTVAEDGETVLCIYHARPYEKIVGDPLYDPNRHAHVMEVSFGDDGRPVFEYRK